VKSLYEMSCSRNTQLKYVLITSFLASKVFLLAHTTPFSLLLSYGKP